MTGFPALLDLRGRRVVVVGGGAVAARRVRALREAGADALVVAPDVLDEVRAPGVQVVPRPFAEGDLDGAWLVLACTDDAGVNAAVAAAAEARQIFCVRADAATGGTARTSAVARRDGVTVAVNGGDDPTRAVALRDAIAARAGTRRAAHPADPRRPGGGEVALVGRRAGGPRADHRPRPPAGRPGRRRRGRPARPA